MKRVLSLLTNTLLAGLLAILPLWLTVQSLAWLFHFLDAKAGSWTAWVTGGKTYPGAGVLATLVVVLVVGVLVRTVGADRVGRAVDGIVKRIPGVGQIYGTIRSLLDPLSHPESRPFREAVWVDVAPGLRCMGFVTSSPFAEAPGEPPRVNVYLPMSHPYVGYVLTIEPDRLRPCEAAFDEVVSYHFSCGSALPKDYRNAPPPEPGSPARKD